MKGEVLVATHIEVTVLVPLMWALATTHITTPWSEATTAFAVPVTIMWI